MIVKNSQTCQSVPFNVITINIIIKHGSKHCCLQINASSLRQSHQDSYPCPLPASQNCCLQVNALTLWQSQHRTFSLSLTSLPALLSSSQCSIILLQQDCYPILSVSKHSCLQVQANAPSLCYSNTVTLVCLQSLSTTVSKSRCFRCGSHNMAVKNPCP